MLGRVNRRRFLQLTSAALAVTALGGRTLGQKAAPDAPRLPLPLVQPGSYPGVPLPGEVQPLAPGERAAPGLPQLTLSPPMPQVHKVQYASNGTLEAAHATLLIPGEEASFERAFVLAREAVRRSYAARDTLGDVAASVYLAGSYAGFGGPPPLLTVSVPRARLGEFVSLGPREAGGYDRLWQDPGMPTPPARTPSRELERVPVFTGTPEGLARQRVQQLASQLLGGPRGGLFFHGSSRLSAAALSFDDAPHPIYAPLLLDSLRRADVRATFFCIGRNARAYPYFVRDVHAAGHEVGNHTYHHVRLTDLPEGEVRDELVSCSRVLTGITGQPVAYFRPPGGRYSPLTLRVAESLGLTTTFWTDDPADFDNVGQSVLAYRLSRRLRDGGIVLLHDNVLQSVMVLPRFLAYARQRGVHLETVGRLAAE